MTTEDFTLAAYTALLARFRALGYVFVDFDAMQPSERHLILRHDVDMSLSRAVDLAEIEAEADARSTYYVLLGSELYNPRSPASLGAMRRLLELGHNIGLHFDASIYPQERGALELAAARECELLEDFCGAAVTTISFHRPAPQLQGLAGRFADRLHSYEPRFFSDIGYCSDSQGRWRFGHPLEHPAIETGTALQLVTHPVWWSALPDETVIAKLRRLLLDFEDRAERELALNCIPFKDWMRERVETL